MFEVKAGTVPEQRDARGAHPLLFGSDDDADKLQALAPGVFTGGGSLAVQSAYGQFASLLLDSIAVVLRVRMRPRFLRPLVVRLLGSAARGLGRTAVNQLGSALRPILLTRVARRRRRQSSRAEAGRLAVRRA